MSYCCLILLCLNVYSCNTCEETLELLASHRTDANSPNFYNKFFCFTDLSLFSVQCFQSVDLGHLLVQHLVGCWPCRTGTCYLRALQLFVPTETALLTPFVALLSSYKNHSWVWGKQKRKRKHGWEKNPSAFKKPGTCCVLFFLVNVSMCIVFYEIIIYWLISRYFLSVRVGLSSPAVLAPEGMQLDS